MNRFLLTCLTIGLYSASLSASEVTIPNAFSAGTKAVAAEVNANFTAVKDAVDDNHQAINANAGEIGGKQSRVTGSCGAGFYMTAVAEDGTVTCAADDDSALDTRITANTSSIATKQNRVTGTCGADSYMTAVAEDGTVTCAADDDSSLDSRITANTNSIANKQNTMIGGCASGWYLRYVDAAGRVTCQRDEDTGADLSPGTGIEISGNSVSIESSTVSVNASAFKITRPFSCDVGMAVNTKIFVWNGNSCGYTNGAVFFAPVSLPQGVQITSYLCYVTDESSQGQVYSSNLRRLDWNGVSHIVAGTGTTGQTGMSTTHTGVVAVGVPSTSGQYVDNTNNSYYLSVHFQHSGEEGISFTSERGDLTLLGCKVSYVPD